MAILSVNNLTIGYEDQEVLSGLNFSINEGDYLCIVGENGSGKTTLVRTLLGLIPPRDGEIVRGPGFAAGEIGYLPQQTQVQRDFPASVREIVLSGCQARNGLRPFYSKEDRTLVVKNMERMEIADFADRCYRDLSGGQQQRVLLARALCATKKMLLLDEPVTGLDPIATGEMYNLIKLVNLCDNITVIMVSHDIHAAARYATHVLHLGQKQLFFGTSAEYRESALARRFLGGHRI